MIDVSNLKDVLNTLGFVAHGDMYEKAFPEFGCSLAAAAMENGLKAGK